MKISNVLNCIKTTLNVEVEGYFVERFINLCILNKVNIWNIKNVNSGKISFCTTPNQVEKMKPLLKRTKCKSTVTKRQGIYYNLLKYKKRRVALIFFAVLLIGIYVASTFVWDITVEGNVNIPTEDVLAELRSYKWKSKFNISESKISDELRATFYEVAWAGAYINGTTLNIKIVEKVISDDKESNEKIGDIVAKKDAVITKIVAQSGTALYKLESFIEKGSVAIEGKVYVNGEVSKEVHAAGELRGMTEYNFSKEYSYTEKLKSYTGKIKRGIGIVVNNKKIVAKYLPKEYKYDISSDEKAFNIFGLKLSFVSEKYTEYSDEFVVHTKEELLEQGEKDSIDFLNELQQEGKVYIKHVVEVVENDNGIVYNVQYVVDEAIGEFVEIGE